MSDPQVDREGFCPTCGQHHLAESDTEELHAMLAKCERLEREVLAENERLREQLRGAVDPERMYESWRMEMNHGADRRGHNCEPRWKDLKPWVQNVWRRAAAGGQ